MPDLSGTAPPAAGPDARYTVAGFGYDDVSLGFDLSTSAVSLRRVREMDGREIGTTKRLGWEASWGKFENLLGRSFATVQVGHESALRSVEAGGRRRAAAAD